MAYFFVELHKITLNVQKVRLALFCLFASNYAQTDTFYIN